MLANLIHAKILQNHVYNEEQLPVWVIGDVHGCGDQFNELLTKIHETTPECLVFQLGDLIDRGPDLLKVFQLVKTYNVKTCIGNHELNFIQEHFGYKQCRSKARQATHYQFNGLSVSDQEFVITSMLQMKNYLTVEDSDGGLWLLSHAPKKQTLPFNELVNCGAASIYCMSNEPYDKAVYCVHGHQHWNYREINEQLKDETQEWYNIDSGCVYGNELIAMELTTKNILRVPGIDYSTKTK